MYWAPLGIAALCIAWAVVLLLHHTWLRVAGILGGIAALCLIGGIPSLLSAIGHPVRPGLVLIGIIGAAAASSALVVMDFFRGGHKRALIVRKGAGGPGGAGGKKGHHLRPLAGAVSLVVFGLLVFINWSSVTQVFGGGFGTTFSNIQHQQQRAG
jgi:hypothetical protein